ncbi:hypothetical protein A5740_17045 [Mycobacterium sp. GA-1841]|uniref:hypothetical protein n=1 Tax=Mycobacterium sp. GA-1841 TaxID=1834154 RepID=UPI00096C60DF|nr:hypothetical protein [Mycobacterium sp. GA-1841]OMC29967.1 hypothetical protein A5740_17045 [Mycobacterium sp. GA-1841]
MERKRIKPIFTAAVGSVLGVVAVAMGSVLVACSPNSTSPTVEVPVQKGRQTAIPVDQLEVRAIGVDSDNVLYLGGSTGIWTVHPGAAEPAPLKLDVQPAISTMAVAPDGALSFVARGGIAERVKPGTTRAEALPFDKLRQFSGIAVARDGTVYLGDNEHHTLLKLAPGASTPTELPVEGISGLGHMVIDGEDNIYVSMRGTIMKIAKDATTAEPVKGATDHAGGLAVDAAGNLYVTDLRAKTVSRMSARGGDWVQLPFSGLQTPAGIAVDGDGNVYVVNKLGSEIARLAAT